MEPVQEDVRLEIRTEPWVRWSVYWSGIWVGVLAAMAVALLVGLAAIALGAHQIGPAQRIDRWSSVGLGALVFSVVGAFAAFIVGGWVAAKIAGLTRAEPAILHGAIVWLLAVPFLVVMATLGAGSYFGGWYGGLAGTPAWAVPPTAAVDPNVAVAARNGALGAVTVLLIGLIGSVVGGWLASGEPMTLRHYRERDRAVVQEMR
jgi:hypothetical protein